MVPDFGLDEPDWSICGGRARRAPAYPPARTVCAGLMHSFCPVTGKSPLRRPLAAAASRARCSQRRTRFRNALAAENAKPRRKAGKRLGAATSCVSVRSLTPPLQLFELEGPQRATFVTSNQRNRSRLHISGERVTAAGGKAPAHWNHVVRTGYKRDHPTPGGRPVTLFLLPTLDGTFLLQSIVQTQG